MAVMADQVHMHLHSGARKMRLFSTTVQNAKHRTADRVEPEIIGKQTRKLGRVGREWQTRPRVRVGFQSVSFRIGSGFEVQTG